MSAGHTPLRIEAEGVGLIAALRLRMPAAVIAALCAGLVFALSSSVGAESLDTNLNRLFETWRVRNAPGYDSCTAWRERLDQSQRMVFLTITHRLTTSRLAALNVDPDTSYLRLLASEYQPDGQTPLDHITRVYSINGGHGPAPGSGTGYCGGSDNNRLFMSMDHDLWLAFLAAFATSGSNPGPLVDPSNQRVWRHSEDPKGPHHPFSISDETSYGSPRGQIHYWDPRRNDEGEFMIPLEPISTLLHRPGVVGVNDPYVVEMDQDYNLIHDSNPLCGNNLNEYVANYGAAGPDPIDLAWQPASCPPPQDFDLFCNTSSLSVNPGGQGSATCTIVRMTGGKHALRVNLTCSNVPVGVSCVFTPNPVTPPEDSDAESVLTVAVSNDTLPNTYTFQVQGARSGSQTQTFSIALTVSGLPPNQPPLADAGADQGVRVRSLVTLNGSGSSDPDNGPSPLSYSWAQRSGPAVTLNNPGSVNPSFTPTVAGSYVFRLSASDGAAVATDDVLVVAVRRAASDYDGDGKTDIAVWRPGEGRTYVLPSATGAGYFVQWGLYGDIPMPGDYDGDGKTDVAVWRPSEAKTYVIRSSTGAQYSVAWGSFGDIPLLGDYDADGKTDIAVYRPGEGRTYVLPSATGAGYSVEWGVNGDVPVPGDYDGDGKTDIAVRRGGEGTTYVIRSSTGAQYSVAWGSSGDIPEMGDYDGDGRTDIAVYRPSDGRHYVLPSSTGVGYAVAWGIKGDIPLVGDYNGDGKTDVAVFRPSEAKTHVILSSTGAQVAVAWGAPGDIPTARSATERTDLVIDLGAQGLWTRTDNAALARLHPVDTEIVVTGDFDGNGKDEIAIDFGPSYGIWILWNGTSWSQLHSLSPSAMASGDLDDNGRDELIIAFPGAGLWVFANGGGWWPRLNDQSPTQILVADLDGGGGDLVVDFGTGGGVWIRYHNGTWLQVHPLSTTAIVAGNFDGLARDDLAMVFPGLGIWMWKNNGQVWVQVHATDPVRLAAGNIDANPQAELVVDFSGWGIGIWRNSTYWTKLHEAPEEQIVLADLDGNGQDEIIVDFGTGAGLWSWTNDSTWVRLTDRSPESMVPGQLN